MAVIENVNSEQGDVLRISTDTPIIGLLTLNSFIDNTEGDILQTQNPLYIEGRVLTDEISSYCDIIHSSGVDIVTFNQDLSSPSIEVLSLFIFGLIESHSTGWCLGKSSPTWSNTEFMTNLIKGYEFTEDVVDLNKYILKTVLLCYSLMELYYLFLK